MLISLVFSLFFFFFFFFFNDTATTEIYTLSLHDALPISGEAQRHHRGRLAAARLEDAERLAADPRPTGQLTLREAALLPGPAEPRLEPGHAQDVSRGHSPLSTARDVRTITVPVRKPYGAPPAGVMIQA